ncbi:MAG TPA: hypothetical protein PKM43_08750 [Verrucomicrobiota bacterium]|nr:hypothetical protein [Verrucomicrobiota bacterium]
MLNAKTVAMAMAQAGSVLSISDSRLRIAALAASCSRICIKARTTNTLIATASGLFNAVAAMMAPFALLSPRMPLKRR